MATKYQRIIMTLHRAFSRGDIDESTLEELVEQAERAAETLEQLIDQAGRAAGTDSRVEREEYQRDHARDYRKHER